MNRRCQCANEPCKCTCRWFESMNINSPNEIHRKCPVVQVVNTYHGVPLIKTEPYSIRKQTPSQMFYGAAKQYWSHVAATNDGMLGGFSDISWLDIMGSEEFLIDILKMKPCMQPTRALDCGAGIGRVTQHLLVSRFEQVDLVEQNERFIEQAKKNLVNDSKHVGRMFVSGLQNFTPEENCYDLIWCQWVLGHLTDIDLCEFFRRCSKALTRHGVIIIKENIGTGDKSELDPKDSSFTRPLKLLKDLISAANLRILKCQRQNNFPKELLPVYMIAMKPAKTRKSTLKETPMNNHPVL